jgi:DNA repair exonuclease SbcCD ATPase subunit
MINFQCVRYKNFLSSGDNFTEIPLNIHKHTLVIGQNGSGKSTLLDAISFALFGKAHRNINKPQLVNSVNAKKCLVEVEFTIGSKSYKVVRGIKPGKFEIYVDGTLLNQNSHAKEYQKILESNILKLNHQTFHQVVVLGSSSFTPFMQLGAWHRRQVIEDLLDINVFTKMNILLKEKNGVLREKINQVSHAIEINETKIEAQKKYIRDVAKLNNDSKKQFEDQIEKKKMEIKKLQGENKDLSVAHETLTQGLAESMSAARNLVFDLKAQESEVKTHITNLVKDAKFYENHSNCPTCEQDIDEELKERKLEEAKVKAGELQHNLAEVTTKQGVAEQDLEEWEAQAREATKLNHKQFDNNERIEHVEIEIESLEWEIEFLTEKGSDLAKANDDYDALMKEFHELVGQKATHNDQYAYNTVILEMLKDTGIKTKIIKQYLPAINKLVNQFLQILDFYVHFNLDESFNETIRSRHRDAFSYDSFSEGEKQRIDLALLFTWRQIAKMKNSIATNLLILDETFDSSLDEAGIENLMKILHTLGEDTNVFVISHKGEVLDGKFEAKIEFEKHKNFSRMKVSN